MGCRDGAPSEGAIVVTGAASGIGRAIARELADPRRPVALVGRDVTTLQTAAVDISRMGCLAQAYPLDVRDRSALERMAADVRARWGDIGGVVANAGVFEGGAAATMPQAVWETVIGTNLTGAWLTVRACLPHLRRPGGSIVLTASILAVVSGPGRAAYSASKAGLIGLARGLAMDLAREGIRVNAISPGSIDTPLMWPNGVPSRAEADAWSARVPLARVGTPQEVARVVRFLLSDDAAYMTGTNIVVDGGVLAMSAAIPAPSGAPSSNLPFDDRRAEQGGHRG